MDRQEIHPTHSPEPWTLYADVPSTDPNWHIITTQNRQRIICNIHIEPGNQTDLANARLIVAAPELLGALEEFAKEYEGFENEQGEPCPTLARAISAIKKARGEK